jgi:2-polyprenyl-3-methyl-5-hydroxy-6-metoxy-1,4-benzoquinol methylase
MRLREYYESNEYFTTLLRLAETPGSSGERRNQVMLKMLGERRSGLRVLDVGCGIGGFSRSLSQGNEITGIDVNQKCLQYNTDRLGYRSICLDIERPWNLGEEKFDLILCGDVLEHVFDPVGVLHEAANVLSDGGRLIVAIPNVGYWKKRARLLFKGELSDDLRDEHIRFFNLRLITKALQLAGWQVKNSVPYSWKEKSAWFERLPLPTLFAWGFVVLSARTD